MKINMKKQIPNTAVYLAVYAVLFGVSGWLLIFHKENPTNWVLYVGLIYSVLAGLVKFALHTRNKRATVSINPSPFSE
jgi:hypothetical protein